VFFFFFCGSVYSLFSQRLSGFPFRHLLLPIVARSCPREFSCLAFSGDPSLPPSGITPFKEASRRKLFCSFSGVPGLLGALRELSSPFRTAQTAAPPEGRPPFPPDSSLFRVPARLAPASSTPDAPLVLPHALCRKFLIPFVRPWARPRGISFRPRPPPLSLLNTRKVPASSESPRWFLRLDFF